ncbi:MAG: hypothetical protein JXA09_05135 [Anaerolineae bacterium]|nr:hypothetical protein [Anaerolineae bacterium]
MNGMIKAGLIGLLAGGVLGIGITLFLPYCTPCAAVVIGLGVGFLASLWDKPPDGSSSAALGAKGGAIAGVGHLAGQILGMLINALVVGPEKAAETLNQLGLDTASLTPRMYWLTQIVVNTTCGLTNIAIAAGLGALGGLLWYQTVGKNRATTAL